jgi:hypothetical protein
VVSRRCNKRALRRRRSSESYRLAADERQPALRVSSGVIRVPCPTDASTG